MIFIKNRFVGIRLDTSGLVACGPHIPGLLVTQENKTSPTIARGVFTPTSDGNIAPAAIARACCGEHDAVTSVGKQLRAWGGVVGRSEAADHRRNKLTHFSRCRNFLRTWTRNQDVSRGAFLQQQFGGSHRSE